MKRCLIIKTSSLGDIIHTLPALGDAVKALGDIQFDWVVEESFSEIPAWHPAVKNVIPVALRRWRKTFFKSYFGNEWKEFKQQIKARHYDVIIDAQGLLKSAMLTRHARGKKYGLDKLSAREPIASWFYHHPQCISKDQHAVERVRQLFGKSLGYTPPKQFDYGIKDTFKTLANTVKHEPGELPQIVFFHGTTWETKHWPEIYWLQLAKMLINEGFNVLLPWGSETEKKRAERINEQVSASNKANKSANGFITVLPKMSLNDMLVMLSDVAGVIAVDTGLAHLAAALDIPLVSLFGPTNPGLTRPYGASKGNQLQLQVDYACIACLKRKCELSKESRSIDGENPILIKPACYSALTPDRVMQALNRLIDR